MTQSSAAQWSPRSFWVIRSLWKGDSLRVTRTLFGACLRPGFWTLFAAYQVDFRTQSQSLRVGNIFNGAKSLRIPFNESSLIALDEFEVCPQTIDVIGEPTRRLRRIMAERLGRRLACVLSRFRRISQDHETENKCRYENSEKIGSRLIPSHRSERWQT